jgi:hypothetical protein
LIASCRDALPSPTVALHYAQATHCTLARLGTARQTLLHQSAAKSFALRFSFEQLCSAARFVILRVGGT